MKLWVPQSPTTYTLVGKFPHTYINQLLVERKIEYGTVDVAYFKLGYKVLQPFSLDVIAGLTFYVNNDFIITGE